MIAPPSPHVPTRTCQDAFNKWEASQALAQRVLLATTASLSADPAAAAPAVPATLVAAFKGSLALALGGGADRSLLAYALALPSLSELADAAPLPVDPLALVAARRAVKAQLAAAAAGELAAVYDSTAPPPAFSIEGAEMGRRALRNVALDYLCAVEEAPDRAWDQYRAAECMTDKVSRARSVPAPVPPPVSCGGPCLLEETLLWGGYTLETIMCSVRTRPGRRRQ